MRSLSPLLLAALCAALHVAQSAVSPPAAPHSNHPINARRLHWSYVCGRATRSGLRLHAADYGPCNMLGYYPDDIPAYSTTPIAMVGGIGGGPGSVSYCNMTGPEAKYAAKIQIFSDQETHSNLHYVDQITVTWSDGSSTRVGGCDRPGSPVMDCDAAMQRSSDNHVVDLSGDRRVTDYNMAIDGSNDLNFNPGTAGRLFGLLTMTVTSPSTGTTELAQGYKSCCAGYRYHFEDVSNIGSGKVCGITYRSGSKVDAFGLVFHMA